jgi:hypothetical protein
MKILKWLIGVPAGIFALMVVWQLLSKHVNIQGGSGPAPNFIERTAADCQSEVNSLYVSGRESAAIALKAECDALPKQTNPGKVYGPNGWEPAK